MHGEHSWMYISAARCGQKHTDAGHAAASGRLTLGHGSCTSLSLRCWGPQGWCCLQIPHGTGSHLQQHWQCEGPLAAWGRRAVVFQSSAWLLRHCCSAA